MTLPPSHRWSLVILITAAVVVGIALRPWVGIPGAVSGGVGIIIGAALPPFTVEPLTRGMTRRWCRHRNLPPPPRSRRVRVRRAIAVVSVATLALAATSLWVCDGDVAMAALVWTLDVSTIGAALLTYTWVCAWRRVRWYTKTYKGNLT